MYQHDSPGRVVKLDAALGESQTKLSNAGHVNKESILLDKDERALLRKGENITKEQMWELLEKKRFD